jgi:hypothetical protein
MDRYRWVKRVSQDHRLELLDRATSRNIAVIISVGRTWYWMRNTTPLLHGVSTAQGTTRTLGQAKSKIPDGLPQN